MALVSICIFLLSGTYAAGFLGRLPADDLFIFLASLSCLSLSVKKARPVGIVLFGFLLMWSASRDVLGEKPDPLLVSSDVAGTFEILDFPKKKEKSVTLLVQPVGHSNLPNKIRLSWYDAPVNPKFGECWALSVRLRRPRGFSNPAGFDYEGWLFREAIGATGYVRKGEPVLSCDSISSLALLRI